MMGPRQTRLSWLMAATAGVAVGLAQLRQASGMGEALLISLFYLLPALLFGLLLVKWVIPFVLRIRSASPDREGRRSCVSMLWHDVADWVVAIVSALIVFCFFYYLILIVLLALLVGPNGLSD